MHCISTYACFILMTYHWHIYRKYVTAWLIWSRFLLYSSHSPLVVEVLVLKCQLVL